MAAVAIALNDIYSLRGKLPDDVAEFIRETSISLFREHGGSTFCAEFDPTCYNGTTVSVSVNIARVEGTDVSVLHAETKTVSLDSCLKDYLFICVYR